MGSSLCKVIDLSEVLELSKDESKGCVATIGFFDGVHRGHRFLIRQVTDLAKRNGQTSLLVTFPSHPMKVIRPEFVPALLTPGDEKFRMLRNTGIDKIALCEFTKSLSCMSARDFMERILLSELNVKTLVIGYDHHFGHDRTKGFDDYVAYGKELGISVVKNEEYKIDGFGKIASSSVRRALQNGDVELANSLLGYSYYIEGSVVNGFHVGRQIGFPTANIQPDYEEKLIPKDGVYVVRVTIGDENQYIGMMNIGRRPTLDNGKQRTIEVHLLDFNGNIYSEHIKVEFMKWLREEHKFGDLETLREQLSCDEAECRKYCSLK